MRRRPVGGEWVVREPLGGRTLPSYLGDRSLSGLDAGAIRVGWPPESVVLLVRGEVSYGRWADFLDAAQRYREYRRRKGYAVPELLLGMTGPRDTALFVGRHSDGKAREDEDRVLGDDREYAEIASSMPYREGTLHYELFRAA